MRTPVTREKHMTVSIDLEGLAPSKRFPFWNDVICTHYSPSENKTHLPPSGFTADMRGRSIGRVDLSYIRSTPMTSVRSRESLRKDPLDCFFVSLLTEGQARVTQSGRKTIQRAGDFLMYDSAQPFEIEMLSNYSGYWLRLPRNLVTTHMANPTAMTARTSPTQTGVGRLAHAMLLESLTLDLSGPAATATRIANSLLDVISATLEAESGLDEQSSSRHVNLLDGAKSYMLANLDDPDLDVEAVVQALSISRRTLNRLFAREGSTPIRWLWRQRLERSKKLLESGQEIRVTSAALACGFSDFSHFSRAFKTEFGMPPKALLEQSKN